MVIHTSVHIKEMVFAHDQLMRGKTLTIITTISSFTRDQKVVSHTAAHYRIGVCMWPTSRGAKHFNSTSYFLYAGFVYTACTFFPFATQRQYRWDMNTKTMH